MDTKNEQSFQEVIEQLFKDLDYARNNQTSDHPINLKWFIDNKEKYRDIYCVSKQKANSSYKLSRNFKYNKDGTFDKFKIDFETDEEGKIKQDELFNYILKKPVTCYKVDKNFKLTTPVVVDRIATNYASELNEDSKPKLIKSFFGLRKKLVYPDTGTELISVLVTEPVGYLIDLRNMDSKTYGRTLIDLDYNVKKIPSSEENLIQFIKGFGNGMNKKVKQMKDLNVIREVIEKINGMG